MNKNVQFITGLKGVRSIVAVTAYDTIIATIADRADVDLILVGDSVGTTLLGFDSTIPVTLDMMVHHTAAVVRAKTSAMVVSDIPFPVAHKSFETLLNSCSRLMQLAGAGAVKIEGGAEMADKVSKLVNAGIPVVGHIGLLPQRYHVLGGYRKYGKSATDKTDLINDAKFLQDAGAFAIVGEMIDAELAAKISKSIDIPLIGIGCGSSCDGQILVSTDLLGLTQGKIPSFVKKYADLSQSIEQAFKNYVDDVIGNKTN